MLQNGENRLLTCAAQKRTRVLAPAYRAAACRAASVRGGLAAPFFRNPLSPDREGSEMPVVKEVST